MCCLSDRFAKAPGQEFTRVPEPKGRQGLFASFALVDDFVARH